MGIFWNEENKNKEGIIYDIVLKVLCWLPPFCLVLILYNSIIKKTVS